MKNNLDRGGYTSNIISARDCEPSNVFSPERAEAEKKAKEYLASLLYYSEGAQAKRLADGLIDDFGTLDGIFDIPADELISGGGLAERTAVLLKLAVYLAGRRIIDSFPLGKRYGEEIKELLPGLFLGYSVEVLYMLLIDGKGRLSKIECFGEGAVASSDLYPRRLLECAIRNDAREVIVAHNHPRGTTEPSSDDIYTTKMLARIFSSSGIRLLAHYVVAGREVGEVPIEND